jgi:four helix bundle protein
MISDCRLRIADCGINPDGIMEPTELKARTNQFALRIIRMVEALSRNRTSDVIGKQVLRSGTSVGANYRAACRAKSRADFISKTGTVEEECDESMYWMELLADSGQVKASRLEKLMEEADELLRIVVASSQTARRNANPQSAIRNPQCH